MLREVSIAKMNEKELVLIFVLRVKPEMARIMKKITPALKNKMTMFFENKSTPLILAIASKLANFNAFFLWFWSVKKWIKTNTGIANKRKMYLMFVNVMYIF